MVIMIVMMITIRASTKERKPILHLSFKENIQQLDLGISRSHLEVTELAL